MKDAVVGKIKLDDISPDVAREFIETIYTMNFKKKNLIDFFKLVDKYQIDWLKNLVSYANGFMSPSFLMFEFVRDMQNISEPLITDIVNHLKTDSKNFSLENSRIMLGLNKKKESFDETHNS